MTTAIVATARDPDGDDVAAARMRALDALIRARLAPAPRAALRTARRIGMELEVLPVRAATGAPVLPRHGAADGPGTLGVLARLAHAEGWRAEDTGYGVPRFLLPDGAVLSFEPGGQLEWSSAVHATPRALDDALRATAARLADAMAAAGIRLLARGVDPVTPPDGATMVVRGERYRRQQAHYDRRGTAGRAMMLQTAGIHLNLDTGDDPVAAWGVANTLAPLLVAIFANSPARAGAAAPARSHRAMIWRALDPTRTAVFAPAADPVPAYLAFALAAQSFLLGESGAPPRTFAEWLAAGVSEDDLARHLSTLFPEVRPRGYLELRSVDALPARWAALPAAVAWAAVHHAPLRHAILRELPAPTAERLARAGSAGLGDPALAEEARWLAARVPDALRAETRDDAGSDALARRLEDFLARYTHEGRDPGSVAPSYLES